jgi:soluble lytic murein transglycosylase-like protein
MLNWNKWKTGCLVGALCICAPGPELSFALAAEPAPSTPARALLLGGGRLELERAEQQGDWARLHLAGGGEIAVPASRLLKIEFDSNTRSPRTEAPAAASLPLAPEPSPAAAPRPLPPAAPAPAARATLGSARESGLMLLIDEAASRHELDPVLVTAMVRVESNFNARAVSRAGAQGLLQLMPQTSRRLGVADPFDPRQNLDAGARHFRSLLDSFAGDIVLALAAYNAGEDAVRRHGGLPPFSETRSYVDRVLTHFSRGF